MQELIAIKNKPALVEVNFDELKQHLAKQLERYDVLVTAETLKDAKTLATELNATKKVIDTRRKEEVAKASEPVKAFDGQMKELVSMCEDGRQKILGQVQKFEDETRALASDLLESERDALRKKLGIDPEYHKAEFDDLILISSVTTGNKLTAKARSALESRVQEERSLQDQTKMRLLELENQSYKAGLSAPLTRDHVRHFLFADAEHYATELQRILDAEVQRQQMAEQRMREQMERENEQRERQERERAEREARLAEAKPAPAEDPAPEAKEPEPEPTPVVSKTGATPITVTCTFSTTMSLGITEQAVEDEIRRVLAKAGITTLSSVTITKNQKAA